MSLRVGLEVHVPLASEAKLFCPCPANDRAEPNRAICPTCTGQPGARPQGINRGALARALEVAHLLHLELEETATVQRKHYVYPDLPNNYQRTSTPLGLNGRFWEVGIREAHIEEDPGAYDLATGHVDLNRSGTPLVEIVTEPDLTSAEDVATWLRVLRLTLERAGVLRGGAELKADVNVSLEGGDRVEVKNVVGARNAAHAVTFEATRQRDLLDGGERIAMETRHFDEARQVTHPSRKKETVGDYRYMPDPDLRRLDVMAADPGAPDGEPVPHRLAALQEELDLELGEALALMEDASLEALFLALREATDDDRAVEIALVRLRGELDYRDATLSELEVDPALLLDLARAWHEAAITKQVFTRLLRRALDDEGDVAQALAKEREASQGLDLPSTCAQVLEENPDPVQDFLDGHRGAVNFLVGQVMKETRGRADAQEARETLLSLLEEER